MEEPRPRLLFVSPLPPPQGGIATWTAAIAQSPLAERFEIRVVDASPSAKGSVSQESRFRLDRVLDAARILGQLAWQLLTFRPHLVHVNTNYYWAFLRDGLAVRLARRAGARTLLHFRGGDFPDFVEGASPAFRRYVEATLRRTDRLVALTARTQAFLGERVQPERVRFVPNFVRLEDLGEVPDRASRDGPPEVLYVGWLVEAKGVGELLAAARALPRARFTLVGPQEPAFVASIRPELEALADRVELLPERGRAEVVELYRRADVHVLPSHREGFPNVVLEAMAAGLPVVATTVGAIPDAVRDEQEGLLVPPQDAEALTGALRRLVDDRALRLRLGRQARQRAETVFSLPAVCERLAAVYGELLSP